MSSFSVHSSVHGRCSEPERSSSGESSYYTDNYTSDRPPHLNDDNFSSTQPGGPAYEPRRPPSVQASELDTMHVTTQGRNYTPHYPASSRSANTSSTVRGGDPLVPRPHVDFFANQYNYDDPGAVSLTAQAISTHNHSNETLLYNGDIPSWVLGAGYNIAGDGSNDGNSRYVQVSSDSGRHSSVATDSSWTMVAPAHDSQAETFTGIGGWQADIAADTYTLASRIPDEDTQD
ncbi:hypothetical protein GGR52DRAFT_571901 [Hypoxylon sp. FL1284]|nr:hypothetical protein GGR52DRAFT_571901 [Hypoxylon sp. FL1284]